MKLLSLLACLSLISITGAAASAADSMSGMNMSTLTVSTAFDPKPPHQGAETIIVTVKDAMGKPVKGAKVKIATNMPAMSMAGPKLTAQDNGDGTYSAQTNLNYATTWSFAVTASAGGKNGNSTTKLDIR
jgi:nitrogen fixation protein FixH